MIRFLFSLLFAVACSAPVDPVGSTLAAPWGELNLPVADGKVEEATGEMLHVLYESEKAQFTAEIDRYRASLVRQGWTAGAETGLGKLVSIEFEHPEKDHGLNLIVATQGARIDVSIFLRKAE